MEARSAGGTTGLTLSSGAQPPSYRVVILSEASAQLFRLALFASRADAQPKHLPFIGPSENGGARHQVLIDSDGSARKERAFRCVSSLDDPLLGAFGFGVSRSILSSRGGLQADEGSAVSCPVDSGIGTITLSSLKGRGAGCTVRPPLTRWRWGKSLSPCGLKLLGE